jgi:hypothetical protein
MPIEYQVNGQDTLPKEIKGHSGIIVSVGTAFAMALAISASLYTAITHQNPHDPLKKVKYDLIIK